MSRPDIVRRAVFAELSRRPLTTGDIQTLLKANHGLSLKRGAVLSLMNVYRGKRLVKTSYVKSVGVWELA